MHFPSKRIYSELTSEAGRLWYSLANHGEETAVLIKAPSNTLKAVATGCQIDLLFGLYTFLEIKFLCVGIRIYDTPDTPLLLFALQRYEDDHQALERVLASKKSPIYLFNEMDTCVASGELCIPAKSSEKSISLIGDTEKLYIGRFEEHFNKLLDEFHLAIDPTIQVETDKNLVSISVPVQTTGWSSHIIEFVGFNESNETNLTGFDEGEYFENKIWFALDSVFGTKLYKSPQVKIGNKSRELTDILAFSEERLFLIEAKSLSVIKAGFERNQERKIKGITQQVEKATKQLEGALGALVGYIYENHSKSEILITTTEKPHCIVLISELVQSESWSGIVDKIIDITKEKNCYFHVLDLQELIFILKLSSGDMHNLNASLQTRFEVFLQTKSLHLRATV